MPKRPKRPCSYPGCPNLTDKRFCPEHEKLEAQRYERYDRDLPPSVDTDGLGNASGIPMLRSIRCVRSALRKVCTRQPRRFTTSSRSLREGRTTAVI